MSGCTEVARIWEISVILNHSSLTSHWTTLYVRVCVFVSESVCVYKVLRVPFSLNFLGILISNAWRIANVPA